MLFHESFLRQEAERQSSMYCLSAPPDKGLRIILFMVVVFVACLSRLAQIHVNDSEPFALLFAFGHRICVI